MYETSKPYSKIRIFLSLPLNLYFSKEDQELLEEPFWDQCGCCVGPVEREAELKGPPKASTGALSSQGADGSSWDPILWILCSWSLCLSQGQAAAPCPLGMGFRDREHLSTAKGHHSRQPLLEKWSKWGLFASVSYMEKEAVLWWAEQLLPA